MTGPYGERPLSQRSISQSSISIRFDQVVQELQP